MIAAITLKILDPFGTGKLVLFQVTYDKVCWYSVHRGQKHSTRKKRIGMPSNCYHSCSLVSSEVFMALISRSLIIAGVAMFEMQPG